MLDVPESDWGRAFVVMAGLTVGVARSADGGQPSHLVAYCSAAQWYNGYTILLTRVNPAIHEPLICLSGSSTLDRAEEKA